MTEQNLEKANSEMGQEEATSAEDTSVEETTKNSDEDIEAKNRQLYERAKKAEERAKEEEAKRLMLEKEYGKVAKQATGTPIDQSDLDKRLELLREQNLLKDKNDDESKYLIERAKKEKISLPELMEKEDVQIYLRVKREELERSEKTPEPSTKQSPTKKDVSQWTNEDLRQASERQDWDAIDQFRKFMRQK